DRGTPVHADEDRSGRLAVPTRLKAATAGLLGGGVALACGELAAAMSRTVSPVVAIADLVIDRTPGGLVRTGIRVAGHRDKPALVIGTVVIALTLAAAAGAAGRRRAWAVAPLFAGAAAIGVATLGREPGERLAAAVAVPVASAAAGVATSLW